MNWNNPFRRTSATPGEPETVRASLTGDEVREAYERGRRDGRAERKRHPMGMTFLFAAAIVGVGVLAYAVFEGSFEGGGDRLDRDLTAAVKEAEPKVRNAVRDAGQQIKDSVRKDGPAPAP